MKKTMFITSVIMVVVMAIALTTSSLAWFTASGATTVTTTVMQVSAKADAASTGIAISLNGESNWNSNVTLSTTASGFTTANTNLLPVVPFAKKASGIDADDLLAALVGGTEDEYDEGTNENLGTAADDTAYLCYMIGNKIDTNKNFADPAGSGNLTRAGYYTTQFYVTNTASGDGALSVKVQPTISFYLPDGTTAYNETNRNNQGLAANQYDLDATLCVAVLAKVGEFTLDDDSDDGWEIIGYADSRGGATVRLGKDAAAFGLGQGSTSSTTYISNTAFASIANTEAIGPAVNGAEFGQVKTIKVVAWYDATTLNNNNASAANLKFGLSFARVAVGA